MQKRYKLNNIADIYYFVIITKFNNNENNLFWFILLPVFDSGVINSLVMKKKSAIEKFL